MSKQHSLAAQVPPIAPHVRGVGLLISSIARNRLIGSFGSHVVDVPPLEDPPLLLVDPLDEPPLLLVDPLDEPPLDDVVPLDEPPLLLVLFGSSFFGAGGFDGGSVWLSCSGSALFTLLVVPPGSSSTGASAHAARTAMTAKPDTRPRSLREDPPEESND